MGSPWKDTLGLISKSGKNHQKSSEFRLDFFDQPPAAGAGVAWAPWPAGPPPLPFFPAPFGIIPQIRSWNKKGYIFQNKSWSSTSKFWCLIPDTVQIKSLMVFAVGNPVAARSSRGNILSSPKLTCCKNKTEKMRIKNRQNVTVCCLTPASLKVAELVLKNAPRNSSSIREARRIYPRRSRVIPHCAMMANPFVALGSCSHRVLSYPMVWFCVILAYMPWNVSNMLHIVSQAATTRLESCFS